MEKSTSSARDVFLHLFMIIALVVSVVSFINLLFGYIDVLIKDPLQDHYWPLDGIRNAMASLIVAFPLYLWTTWHIRKDVIVHPEKREYILRKFLVYLTLFAAAIAMMVDLIVLITNFLNGELTLHFLLKILVVLVVTAGVFAYYFWDIRRETTSDSKPSKVLATSVALVVIVSIVSGFFAVGSPSEQRARRFDMLRQNHLQNLQANIVDFWNAKNKLPESMEEIKSFTFKVPADPGTGEWYEYIKSDNSAYQLCATFSFGSEESEDLTASAPYFRGAVYPAEKGVVFDPYYAPEGWRHSAGRVCFARKIKNL